MATLKAVCKINKNGDAEIVYRNPPDERWPLTFYVHVGQHGEGDMEYFRTLRPARNDTERARCSDLIAEYRQICAISGEDLRIMRRLTS